VPYQCRFLTEESIPELYQTFIEAFSDYAIDMNYMSAESLLNRALKNGIDFELSVGAYDNGQMVGFTMIGVDHRNSVLCAFDISTGIIKPYRGKGMTKEMFSYAVPKLKEKGVKKFVLEVLQENQRAIKAYQKTGFIIVREFDCFELNFDKARFSMNDVELIEIRPIAKEELELCKDFLDWQPSWETSFASIQRIPDKVFLFGARYKGELVGLLVYYPALNWIMCIAVKKSYRRKGIAAMLVKHLSDHLRDKVSSVKLINVQHSDEGTINFLKKVGFEIYVKQYEMELDL
jgi:ribosomal protein S18 acetylase RimI-like enzyme